MTSILEARDLMVRRSGQLVLQIPQFEVKEGETLAVIGPNGAGKSTLIMVLSQLLKPEQGELYFRGKLLSPRYTLEYRRQIGMVLQDPLLLDTTVYENVASGLRFRGVPNSEIKPRVEEWLNHFVVLNLRGRRAHALSGGEAQRVSLARAMAVDPAILFLDEPFSALDSPTRLRLLDDFYRLLSQTRMTTVFITHDMDEALLLGGRVAVIFGHEIRQTGTPQQVFSAPSDPEIARFVGVETIIPGVVQEVHEGLAAVRANGFELSAVGEVSVGQEVLLCLRPEDVTLWQGGRPADHSARNHISGKIVSMTPSGPLERVVVDCGFLLVALITRASARDMELEVGKPIRASFKASAVHLIAR